MVHNQKAAQLHEDIKDAKARWVELHDTMTDAFMEQVNNLEASLRSKIEDDNATEERKTRMLERLKRVMEQNKLHSTTNVELDSKINIVKPENKNLQSKIKKLGAKLQDQEDEDFVLFEKTYAIYHTKRKTLEEAKEGITKIDECITKARELETTAHENLHAQPVTFDYSNSNSEYSGTEGETEEDEGLELEAEEPSPNIKNEDYSLPSGSGSKN
ncbi:GRIP domain-containing protein RUD3-like [Nicotiana sylvestris]|uniref:GRIP domain-containing protein RUD3-like n=1 Tax=Nicotiana sylvestris TaxID=4096 RepID=UPI00388CB928